MAEIIVILFFGVPIVGGALVWLWTFLPKATCSRSPLAGPGARAPSPDSDAPRCRVPAQAPRGV